MSPNVRKLATLLTAFAAVPILTCKVLAAQASDSGASAVIHADQSGPKIDRHIFGQFAEHLGRGIEEGVWVGEHSSIPNVRGLSQRRHRSACASCMCRWCAGQAAASRTNTTGATASVLAPRAPSP